MLQFALFLQVTVREKPKAAPEPVRIAPLLPSRNILAASGGQASGTAVLASSTNTGAPPSVPCSLPPANSLSQTRADQPAQMSSRPEQVVGFGKVPATVAVDATLPTTSIQDHPVGVQQQGAALNKLRSIATPAQQLKQKDAQIAALQTTVEDLQEQLAASEQLKAECVSAAVESAKAGQEHELQSRAGALSAVRAELEACRNSADVRERQHQVKHRSMLANVTVMSHHRILC